MLPDRIETSNGKSLQYEGKNDERYRILRVLSVNGHLASTGERSLEKKQKQDKDLEIADAAARRVSQHARTHAPKGDQSIINGTS